MANQSCRACGRPLSLCMADLGLSPFSNAFISKDKADHGEMFYPLRAVVCESCWLAQLDHVSMANAHFNEEYVYFSSFSSSWLKHAEKYVQDMTQRFSLDKSSHVVEIASNDGYLLQFFARMGIPCLGIEPSLNTAAAARAKGVQSLECFFDQQCAAELSQKGLKADLLLGNNVLAHVPDIKGFISAMPLALKQQGVITLEFPHLLNLLQQNQFDTIYHEHYSYLSVTALLPLFEQAGLRLFDVTLHPTHGGSLRLFACHAGSTHADTGAVANLLREEENAGLKNSALYADFSRKVVAIKDELVTFLLQAKREGKTVAAYGAAAKGNTLLNYSGVRSDLVRMVADKNTVKQGKLLPGNRIPVCSPEDLLQFRPDYVLILPWNLKSEIVEELAEARQWGAKFVTAIPKLEVI